MKRHLMRGKGLVTGALILLLVLTAGSVFAQDLHTVRFPDVQSLEFYLHWTPERTPLISAHRGGPVPGYPENCVETMEHALTYAPCLIECDVARTRDGVLMMMHDDTLDRTTTGQGPIDSLASTQVDSLWLVDNDGTVTRYRVPTFSQVLNWARGKAVLTVDVKRSVSPEEIVAALEAHNALGYALVITYNADQAVKYHTLNPELMLSVNIRNEADLQRLLDAGIPAKQMVAFVGVSEPDKELYELLHGKGIRTILGTMGNLDRKAHRRGPKVYVHLFEHGADILSTDDVPLVAKSIAQYLDRKKSD